MKFSYEFTYDVNQTITWHFPGEEEDKGVVWSICFIPFLSQEKSKIKHSISLSCGLLDAHKLRWWPSYWSLLSRGTKLSSLLSLSSFHFSGSATSSIPSHLSLMAENSATNGNHDIVLNVNGDLNRVASKANHERSGMSVSVPFLQKVSITTLLFLYICSKPLWSFFSAIFGNFFETCYLYFTPLPTFFSLL